MRLSDTTKIIILVALVVVALYLLSTSNGLSSQPITNDGILTSDALDVQDDEPTINLAKNNKSDYVSSSYNKGTRHNDSKKLDQFFEPAQTNESRDGVSPSETGHYSKYTPSKDHKQQTDMDKFDVNEMLPQEEKSEWFSDPFEATNVKSPNLINIYRPTGVNTSQTTKKNPGHDIRGSVPNPKYPVSPWGNSSYEPDTNIKLQGLC